jgi:fucose permease
MIINRHHQHPQSDDAYITAIFWAFFSLGRLTSIFLATKFSASFMIFIDIVSKENNF